MHPSSPAPSASPSLRFICRWCTLPLTLLLYFFSPTLPASPRSVCCHKPAHPYLVFFPVCSPQPHSFSLLHLILKHAITRIYYTVTLSQKPHGVGKTNKMIPLVALWANWLQRLPYKIWPCASNPYCPPGCCRVTAAWAWHSHSAHTSHL